MPSVVIANSGQLNLAGSSTVVGGLGGAGSVTIGAGGAAQVVVGPLNQTGLNITAGSTLALSSVGSRGTNVVGGLLVGNNALNTTASLDIGTQDLLIGTTSAANVTAVKLLIAAAYNASYYGKEDGDWAGNGITSSAAHGSYDPNFGLAKYSVAYFYGGDPHARDSQHGGNTGANFSLDGVGTNQTLVRTVLSGDVNMDGVVDFNDITQMLGYGTYATGIPATYSQGDLYYHGIVDFSDIEVILGAGNFNSLEVFRGQTAAQAQAKVAGMKRAAKPATITSSSLAGVVALNQSTAAPADLKSDFIYNPATGDLTFILNGLTPTKTGGMPSFVNAITLTSAAGLFVPSALPDVFVHGLGATLSSDIIASALLSGPGFGDGLTSTTFDLGDVLPTGMALSDVQADLTLRYQVMGGGNPQWTDVSAAVPEPSGMAVAGVAAVGLLSRRRRGNPRRKR